MAANHGIIINHEVDDNQPLYALGLAFYRTQRTQRKAGKRGKPEFRLSYLSCAFIPQIVVPGKGNLGAGANGALKCPAGAESPEGSSFCGTTSHPSLARLAPAAQVVP
jgi:hypothetical protein